ncbi:MAG TPA: putative phage abortive infection protein [Bacteroidia bacterium]|jgi:hypothetical protein|nr:putative phage abortive infection protein [Bacteroidia bacterium]
MNICCSADYLSNSDKITVLVGLVTIVVLAITAKVLYDTFKEIKASNEKNGAENMIIKHVEFHYRILQGMEVRNSIKNGGISATPPTVKGQESFKAFYEDLEHSYKEETQKNPSKSETAKIIASFQDIYNNSGGNFGHYFKNLYALLRYIHNIKIEGFDKCQYIKLIKAQLSEYELLLLYYDCIWIKGDKQDEDEIEFMELVIQYNILTALNTNRLIHPIFHKGLFPENSEIEVLCK